MASVSSFGEPRAIGSVNVSVSSFLQCQSRRASVSSYGQSCAVGSVKVVGHLFHHNYGQSCAVSSVKVIGYCFIIIMVNLMPSALSKS